MSIPVSARKANILLPTPAIDMAKWAVIACDQFTSQREYWESARIAAGDSLSALDLVLPEIDLADSAVRTPMIHAAMESCLSRGLLVPAVTDGFLLVERATTAGNRIGLLAEVNLDAYDYSPSSRSLIRATEGTVPERVPPRAAVRRGAKLELPHVLMLMDDRNESVIEPLYRARGEFPLLYDFDTMLGGGHIRGWQIEGAAADRVLASLGNLEQASDGLMFAVGDGNHSLAAAKMCWEGIKPTLSPEERLTHPARYALVELNNIHSPALEFEPIHRILTHVDPADVLARFRAFAGDRIREGGRDLAMLHPGSESRFMAAGHPLFILQPFLNAYLSDHPDAECDYIHGESSLRSLSARDDAVGFMPRAFDKGELFSYVRQYGVLPRKTFSMGEATDKRYYLEARRIL